MWHLFLPQVLVLFMSVTDLLLLRLFELVNLLAVQLAIVYNRVGCSIDVAIRFFFFFFGKKGDGKMHPCTGTEVLYRPYGP